jgi:hypothetical protein
MLAHLITFALRLADGALMHLCRCSFCSVIARDSLSYVQVTIERLVAFYHWDLLPLLLCTQPLPQVFFYHS